MALSDKNIVITPNIGQSSDPQIVFSGADSTTGPQNITIRMYPINNGTLSVEGSAGQLFSITNSLSGSIYSVNDVSGIPSIEVFDTGNIRLAQYSGNVLIGTNTDTGFKLRVNGTSHINQLGVGASNNTNFDFYNNGTSYFNGAIVIDDNLTMSGGYIRMGEFQNSVVNNGEAWLGRASDRATGTVTLQLGTDAARYFEIVDKDWTTVIFEAGMNSLKYKGSTIWHAGNDGASSGLDADLLDGNHASAFYSATNPSGYTSNVGTVTSVSGTGTVSGLTLTGTVTDSGNLTLGGTLSVTGSNFGSQTANTFLAAPNGSNGNPTFRAIVAADIPTLNQNTTGSAATLTTARTLTIGDTGKTFNGSANVSWSLTEIGAASSSHVHYVGGAAVTSAQSNLALFRITEVTGNYALGSAQTATNLYIASGRKDLLFDEVAGNILGSSVVINGGAIATAANNQQLVGGDVYIEGGGADKDPFATGVTLTYGRVLIGTGTNNDIQGTREVVIGKSGTEVKLPGVGTSGVVALGTGGTLTAQSFTSANTVSTIVYRDSSGNFSAGAITATSFKTTNWTISQNGSGDLEFNYA